MDLQTKFNIGQVAFIIGYGGIKQGKIEAININIIGFIASGPSIKITYKIGGSFMNESDVFGSFDDVLHFLSSAPVIDFDNPIIEDEPF